MKNITLSLFLIVSLFFIPVSDAHAQINGLNNSASLAHVLHPLRELGMLAGCDDISQEEAAAISGIQYALLDTAATQLRAAFDTISGTNCDFKIYDYSMYPMVVYADEEDGHNELFEIMKTRVEADQDSDFYILIAKQNSPTGYNTKFRIEIKWPDSAPFDTILVSEREAIRNHAMTVLNDTYASVFNDPASAHVAEIGMLDEMKSTLIKIHNREGALTNSELAEAALVQLNENGFKGFGVDSNYKITTDSGEATPQGDIKDFEGLMFSAGDEDAVLAFADIQSAVFEMETAGIPMEVLLTTNESFLNNNIETASTRFDAFDDQTAKKFIVWVHFWDDPDNGQDSIFFTADVNLSEPEALAAFTIGRNEYTSAEACSNMPGEKLRITFKTRDHWNDGIDDPNAKPLPDIVENEIMDDAIQYQVALASGFVDGFLQTIDLCALISQGVKEYNIDFNPLSGSFWLDFFKKVKEEESLLEGMKVKFNESVDSVKEIIGYAEKIIGLLDCFEMSKIKAFGVKIKNLIITWFGNVTFQNGAATAGYSQGKLIFEIVLEALTFGLGAAPQVISKMAKQVGDAMGDVFTGASFQGFITGLKNNVEYSARLLFKPANPRLSTAYCRTIGSLCFLAGTTVQTSTGAVDISQIQNRLETTHQYALANSFYNNDNSYSTNNYTLASDALINAASNELGVLVYDPINSQNNREQTLIDQIEITPSTWKWVALEQVSSSKDKSIIKLRRPNWWFEINKIQIIGNQVKISLPEMGVSGEYKVLEIYENKLDTRTWDEKRSGDFAFQPILGIFEHSAEEVWDYTFSTGETISATPNHPFYSELRQAYIPIGEVQIGEPLKSHKGGYCSLKSKAQRQRGVEKVYNIEVRRAHNYFVGEGELLVHNECLIDDLQQLRSAWAQNSPPEFPQLTWSQRSEMIADFTTNGQPNTSILRIINGGMGDDIWDALKIDFPDGRFNAKLGNAYEGLFNTPISVRTNTFNLETVSRHLDDTGKLADDIAAEIVQSGSYSKWLSDKLVTYVKSGHKITKNTIDDAFDHINDVKLNGAGNPTYNNTQGIVGAHNLDVFNGQSVPSGGRIEIVNNGSTTVSGVNKIEYKVLAADSGGNPIPGQYFANGKVFNKTTFDPAVYDQVTMKSIGYDGYRNAIDNNNFGSARSFNGSSGNLPVAGHYREVGSENIISTWWIDAN